MWDMVSQETKKKRLEICSSCEHNKVGICKLCKCILQAKTQLKNSRCPINKWSTSQT